ncbi:hypothetical protein J5U18_12660 [Sphingobacteriaceae bacterium WQ 2009]|uniref:Uncharacterized protein n=1 Tax=Rhinopithecimicrobium faecis TaxID=2820698 RepID=A0A8T4HBK0_9SPHI|nr:hypothetical protein [Sphingobacteriaceae bacterium WQ 2009]
MKTIQLKAFVKAFDHGHYRKYKNGFEIRVSNLDVSREKAQLLIDKHQWDLQISELDIRLRSFLVS